MSTWVIGPNRWVRICRWCPKYILMAKIQGETRAWEINQEAWKQHKRVHELGVMHHCQQPYSKDVNK